MAKRLDDSAPVALQKLIKRSGISMSEVARLAGYKHASGLQRYVNPDEYKEHYFPVKTTEKLAKALVGKGQPPIAADDVYIAAFWNRPARSWPILRDELSGF